MSNDEKTILIKPNENKISGKVSRQEGMVNVTLSAHMVFGDVCISIQSHDQSDHEVYDRAQNAIDFIKENQKEKENQYYG